MNRLNVIPFNCPRTCPRFERVDLCRFNPLFSLIGLVGSVNSHTVRVKVQFSNPAALAAAVERLGGRFIGQGEFELFERENRGGNRQRFSGLGFTLPGWNYPLLAQPGGELALDNFNGFWGNVADVERLRAEYAAAAAEQAAAALGWNCERLAGGGLRVFHPAGGFLDVDQGGGVDASGFNGIGCHAAAGELAAAIGRPVEFIAKPEFYQNSQRISVIGG